MNYECKTTEIVGASEKSTDGAVDSPLNREGLLFLYSTESRSFHLVLLDRIAQ